ncbi:hypothetical protein GCM10010508_50360 [Streptomyces naganishii JCM 4654]|uniref:Uncharacterized protein n=1 Tax=Streptomyces naganishii JCM 4654 TaxID=1306179 RepID=A0A918Y8C5_9ACTN|nr:hypothetical protein GCM10010508_50360 [Streptomyces naganishii JCM 4654]
MGVAAEPVVGLVQGHVVGTAQDVRGGQSRDSAAHDGGAAHGSFPPGELWWNVAGRRRDGPAPGRAPAGCVRGPAGAVRVSSWA